MLRKRASGILLHITSLPAQYGIGDLGPEAYNFVDFLVKSKQNYWQVLPLNYTTPQTAHSPYNCSSAFAGNPLLISPRFLYRDGLLEKQHLESVPSFAQDSVEYGKVTAYKKRLFEVAFGRFQDRVKSEAYEKFKVENSFWLEDFTTFISLQKHFGGRSWNLWPKHLKNRKEESLKEVGRRISDEIEYQCFLQYVFYKQWSDLKHYCIQSGVRVIGDIPIYVTYDSPDVWAHPELFKLNRSKRPKFIAGVPPDYFSSMGQLWGNPVYDWEVLKKTQYLWWMERMKHNMKIFDLVRIDHFRGLIAYWQVPAHHKTAQKGIWIEGPGEDFFKVFLRNFPLAPIIAEDLGYITADVREVIAKYDLPTMKILQFAFDGDPSGNPYIPHNHIENCVVYTGTHDNNTMRGWFEKDATKSQKERLSEYLGCKVSPAQVHWQCIRLAMSSVARLAVIPVQDLLGLKSSARMNHPAKIKGNWLWRLRPGLLGATVSSKLRRLTQIYARD